MTRSTFLVHFFVFIVLAGSLANTCANEEKQTGRWIASVYPLDIFDGIPSAISPSGRFLAYGLWDDGNRKIWILDIEKNARKVLTDSEGTRSNYDWSIDEKWIAFSDRSEKRKGIWIVSPEDGKEKQVYHARSDESVSHPRWTKDGTLVFALQRNGRGSLWIEKTDGRAPNKIASGDAPFLYPAISPEGKRVAFVTERNGEQKLCISDVQQGNERCLTDGMKFGLYGRTEWAQDGRTLYFVAASGTDPVLHAWSISVAGGEPQRLENLNHDTLFVFLLKNGALSVISFDPDITIGTVSAEGGIPKQVRPDGELFGFMPAWSPEGRELAYTSQKWNRLGFPHGMDAHVLSRETDGTFGPARVLVAEDMEDYGPTWSPDGKWLAFHSHRLDTDDVYLRKASDSDGPVIRLSWFGSGTETSGPAWSPDGHKLIFCSIPKESKYSQLFEVEIDPVSGQPKSDPRVVVLDGFEGHAWTARYSPDGNRIAFRGTLKDGTGGVFTVPSKGGKVNTVITFHGGLDYGQPEWSRESKSLLFASSNDSGLWQIRKIEAGGGPVQTVTDGPVSSMHPALSPDGKTIAVTLFNAHVKVWILETSSSDASLEKINME